MSDNKEPNKNYFYFFAFATILGILYYNKHTYIIERPLSIEGLALQIDISQDTF